MAMEVVIRKWGNSFGVILPKELVEKEKLELNKKVVINIVKKKDFSDIFGTLKTKMSAQEFKDMVRQGWS